MNPTQWLKQNAGKTTQKIDTYNAAPTATPYKPSVQHQAFLDIQEADAWTLDYQRKKKAAENRQQSMNRSNRDLAARQAYASRDQEATEIEAGLNSGAVRLNTGYKKLENLYDVWEQNPTQANADTYNKQLAYLQKEAASHSDWEERAKQKNAEQQAWHDSIRDKAAIEAEMAQLQKENEQMSTEIKLIQVDNGVVRDLADAGAGRGIQAHAADTGRQIEDLKTQIYDNNKRLQELEEMLVLNQYFGYVDVMENADFAEKSAYDESSSDTLYRAINGDEDAQAERISRHYYGGTDPGASLYMMITEGDQEAYFMTKQEVAIYNYIYSTDGAQAAEDYYEFLQSARLNTARRMDIEEKMRQYAKDKPFLASAGTVLMSPLKVMTAAGQIGDYIGSGELEKDAAYNMFSYAPAAVRAQRTSDIEEKWGKVGSTAYGLGMSAADFLFSTAISGGNATFASALMASSTMADTTLMAKDRGLTDGQAIGLGAVAAVAELITERFSVEALLDGKWEKNALQYILKNGLIEGTEEGASSLINLFADILIAKDQSEWKQEIAAYRRDGLSGKEAFMKAFWNKAGEIGFDVLGGMVTGSALSGGRVVLGNAANVFRAPDTAYQGVIVDTTKFDPNLLRDLNAARTFFVGYAKEHFKKPITNKETGKIILIGRTGIDKFLSGWIGREKYASGFHIPELIEKAHLVDNANNYHPNQVDSIPTYDYYDSPFRIENKNYVAHIRVRNTNMGDRYYGHTVSVVEDIAVEQITEQKNNEIENAVRISVSEKPTVQPVNDATNSISNPTVTQSARSVNGDILPEKQGFDTMELLDGIGETVPQQNMQPTQLDQIMMDSIGNKNTASDETGHGNTMLSEGDLEEYLSVGERKHVRDAKMAQITSGENPILTSLPSVKNFILRAISGKIRNTIKGYGKVGAEMASDISIKSDGTVNIDGYYLELDSNRLEHLSDHIKDDDPRNIPLTEDQILNITEYINSYDDVLSVDRKKDGGVRIKLGKKINGHSVIICLVSKGRSSLQPVTAWQNKTEHYVKLYKNGAYTTSQAATKAAHSGYTHAPEDATSLASPKNTVPQPAQPVNGDILPEKQGFDTMELLDGIGETVPQQNIQPTQLDQIMMDSIGEKNTASVEAENMMLSEDDLADYLSVGERQHVRNSKMEQTKNGGSPILTSISSIRSFIKDSIGRKVSGIIKGYGKVGTRMANDISNASDGALNINGYYMELDSNRLAHLADHMNDDGDPRNIPLTEEQVLNLTEYINDYDDVLDVVTKKDGSTRILLGKRINGHAVIVELVSKGRKSIQPVTAWQNNTDYYNEKYKKTEHVDASQRQNEPKISGYKHAPEDANSLASPEITVPQSQQTVNGDILPEKQGFDTMELLDGIGEQAYYEAGLSGAPMESVNNVRAADLTQEQRQAAYEKGLTEAGESLAAEISASELAPSHGNNAKLVDNKYSKRLSKQDRNVLNKLAQMTGLTIEIADMADGINGTYNPGTGTMTINAKVKNAALVAAAHEITHRMQQVSPAEYRQYRDYVVNAISAKIGRSALEYTVHKYARQGIELTAEEAMDELASDFAMDMVRDGKLFQDLMRENRTAAQVVLDCIKDFIAKVKNTFFYSYETQQDSLAMEHYGVDMETLEAAAKMWENTLNTTRQQVEGKEKTAIIGGTEIRHAIETLPDGKKYVRADRQVIFGNNPDSWSEQVANYINGKIRKGENVSLVAEDGEALVLTSDTAGKIASNKTSNATTMPDEEFLIKANAGVHIDELAQISANKNPNKKPKADKDARHGDFAEGGWTYRTAFFQDFDGKYYRLKISVAKGSDGNVVYNIGDIDERSFPKVNGSSAKDGALKGETSFSDSIFDNPQKSNTQNSVTDTENFRASQTNVRYSLGGRDFAADKYYDRLIDRWNQFADGQRIKVGRIRTGSVLHQVGMPNADMYFDVGKIRKSMGNHSDHLTREILKQIPDLLNDPIVITEFQGPNGNIKNTVSVYGNLFLNGKPVVVGVVMHLDRSGQQLITNVRTIHIRGDLSNQITDESVLFLNKDKKKTRSWLQICGIESVPLEGTKYGLIRSISFTPEIGNTQNSVTDTENFRASRARELMDRYGTIYPGENPHRKANVPRKTSGEEFVSQTIRTVIEAKATPDAVVPTLEELAAEGGFSYERYTDRQAMDDAVDTILDLGYHGALTKWTNAVERGRVSKRNTALGWELYRQAANAGDTDSAISVLNLMVEHQRNAAQALQATRILKKLTPDAQLYGVQKSVSRLQQELKERLGRKAPNLKINKELAAKFLSAETEAEKNAALQELYKDIGQQIPATLKEKWDNWRYLAMLANPRTHIRNIAGNTAFMPVRGLGNQLSAVGQALFLPEEQRTRSLGLNVSKARRDLVAAAKADFDGGAKELVMNGEKWNSADNAIDRNKRIYRFKPLEAARKGNGDLLEWEDMIFSRQAYSSALAGYLNAKGYTARDFNGSGMTRQQKDDARAFAVEEAQRATYRDGNAFSDLVTSIGFRDPGKNVLKQGANMLIEGVLPFQKTPANILARAFEYSPAGMAAEGARAAYDAVANKNFDANRFIDSMSRGLTGSAVMALGYLLAKWGVLKATPEDEDQAALEGRQTYSLELGGKSVTLDWLAPTVMPMFMGAELYDLSDKQTGGDAPALSEYADVFLSLTGPMQNMSLLDGLNSTMESASIAAQNGGSAIGSVAASAALNYVMQAFPTVAGQIERVLAKNERVRQTTFIDKNDPTVGTGMQYTLGRLGNKTPFFDYHQVPYIDAWGRTQENGSMAQRAFDNMLNPAYTSEVEETEVDREIKRLEEATGTNYTPARVKNNELTVNGNKVFLTEDEFITYATAKGQNDFTFRESIMGSEVYGTLDDATKGKLHDLAESYADVLAKEEAGLKPELTDWQEELRDADIDTVVETLIIHAIDSRASSIGKEQGGGKYDGLGYLLDDGQIDDTTAYLAMSQTMQDAYGTYAKNGKVFTAEEMIDIYAAANRADGGNKEKYQVALEEIRRLYPHSGRNDEKAIALANAFGEVFQSYFPSQQEAGAKWQAQYGDAGQDNILAQMSDSQKENYNKYVKGAGVSPYIFETALQYKNQQGQDGKNLHKKEDVRAYVNSLRLTAAQKQAIMDGLYKQK